MSEFGEVEVTSTPAKSSFFKVLVPCTPKNFEGGLPFQRKTLFSEKRVSKYGRLTVSLNIKKSTCVKMLVTLCGSAIMNVFPVRMKRLEEKLCYSKCSFP